MFAAENFNKRSAFVQYSTDESIKNHFIQQHSKANTQSFIYAKYKQPQSIYPIGTSTIPNHYIQHQSIVHNQSTRHFDGWSLKIKNVHSPSNSHQPVILRGAEGEVAESILQQTPLPAERQAGEAAM